MKKNLFLVLCFVSVSVQAETWDQKLLSRSIASSEATVESAFTLGGWFSPEVIIPILRFGSKAEFLALMSSVRDEHAQYGIPWVGHFSPRGEISRGAFDYQVELARQDAMKRDLTLEKSLQNALLRRGEYSRDIQVHGENQMKLFFRSSKKFETQRSLAPVICGTYADPLCSVALNRVMDVMDARSAFGVATSLPEVLRTLFQDWRLQAPLAKLALEILEKGPESLASQNLFSKLVATFEEFDASSYNAVELTMAVMGFYGARGASIAWYMKSFHPGNRSIIYSLQILYSAMAVADQYALSFGRSFSIPSVYTDPFSYGRPYHFWLAAYLAWRLHDEFFLRPRSLFVAIHLAGIGYEMFAPVWGKNPRATYFEKKGSPVILELQKNIWMNDMGALWGLNPKGQSQRSMLRGLALMDFMSQDLSLIPKSTLTQALEHNLPLQWLLWRQIVVPDSHVFLWPLP